MSFTNRIYLTCLSILIAAGCSPLADRPTTVSTQPALITPASGNLITNIPETEKPTALTPTSFPFPSATPTSTPVLSNKATKNGITFTLEKFIEIEGGFQLSGSLDIKDLKLPARENPGFPGLLTMRDANGNRVPVEKAMEPQGNNPYETHKVLWAYNTQQKAFAGPLILTLSSYETEIEPQTTFDLDLGSNPKIGQTWEINRDLDFAGHAVRLLSAQLIDSHTPEWASVLQFTYHDNEGGIFINVMDNVPQTPLIKVNGSGGGGGPVGGNKLASMNYGSVPTGLRHFTIDARVPYRVKGPWQVVWNPPTPSDPVPTPIPEACLTSEKWEKLQNQSGSIPAGVGGKILYTTDAMPPEINIFSANLDGSDVHGLLSAFYPALSPDGTHLAYETQSSGMNILNLNNGQTVSVGTGGGLDPVWSPDGQHILFGGFYVVNSNGKGLKRIKTDSPRTQQVGWLPDYQTIVFGAQKGPVQNLYDQEFKSYNLKTGEIKTLFPLTAKTALGAISPDGQWIAFNDKLFGANLNGAVFIEKLDGSERKLVAMLDDTFVFHPLWSPDMQMGIGGPWMIVNIETPYKPANHVLINPFTCLVVLLPGINGEVQSWIKP